MNNGTSGQNRIVAHTTDECEEIACASSSTVDDSHEKQVGCFRGARALQTPVSPKTASTRASLIVKTSQCEEEEEPFIAGSLNTSVDLIDAAIYPSKFKILQKRVISASPTTALAIRLKELALLGGGKVSPNARPKNSTAANVVIYTFSLFLICTVIFEVTQAVHWCIAHKQMFEVRQSLPVRLF